MDTQFCAKALDPPRNIASKICPVQLRRSQRQSRLLMRRRRSRPPLPTKHRTAKLDKSTPETIPEKPPAPIEAAAPSSAALDKRPKPLLQQQFRSRPHPFSSTLTPTPKPPPPINLDKISRYTDASPRRKTIPRWPVRLCPHIVLSRRRNQARRPGRPARPRVRHGTILGLDQFYSGDYPSAIQHLQNCAKTGTQKASCWRPVRRECDSWRFGDFHCVLVGLHLGEVLLGFLGVGAGDLLEFCLSVGELVLGVGVDGLGEEGVGVLSRAFVARVSTSSAKIAQMARAMSFAPSGLAIVLLSNPRLTPWAGFCRRSAA